MQILSSIFTIHVVLIFSTIAGFRVVEDVEETPNSNATNNRLVSKTNFPMTGSESTTNKSIDMERILQPSQSQTFVVNSVINVSSGFHDNTTMGKPMSFKLTDFKPSPHLETFYEYNRDPVPPAHPEAKTLAGGYNLGLSSSLGSAPWLEKSVKHTFTTETPWASKVRFPPSHSISGNNYGYLPPSEPTATTIVGKRPINTYLPQDDGAVYKQSHFSSSKGSSLYNNHGKETFITQPSKSFTASSSNELGGPLSGFPTSFQSDDYKTRPTEVVSYEAEGDSWAKPKPKPNLDFLDNPKGALGVSPWKKIIKILTAIIPVGLLISALTPSVINIHPANTSTSYGSYGSYNRARMEDELKFPQNDFLRTLENINQLNKDGCEERVLCELLLGAGATGNSNTHVENFVEAFVAQDKKTTRHKEELGRIFEAVKAKNCKLFVCDRIKDESGKPS